MMTEYIECLYITVLNVWQNSSINMQPHGTIMNMTNSSINMQSPWYYYREEEFLTKCIQALWRESNTQRLIWS